MGLSAVDICSSDQRISLFPNMLESYFDFRALRLIPIVPKSSALEGLGTLSNMLCFCTISASIKPAAFTALRSSASGRPPAIQPVHNEISSKEDCGIDFATKISPI
jgi:hypothetical protein